MLRVALCRVNTSLFSLSPETNHEKAVHFLMTLAKDVQSASRIEHSRDNGYQPFCGRQKSHVSEILMLVTEKFCNKTYFDDQIANFLST